jgi:TldD protein
MRAATMVPAIPTRYAGPVDVLTDVVARLERLGASYAEVRHVADARLNLAVRDGSVERLFRARSRGFGVRVLVGGSWGFAARAGDVGDARALDEAAAQAMIVARAAASLGGPRVTLADEEPQAGAWSTPVLEDPFTLPIDAQLALLHAAVDELRRHAGSRARTASAQLAARRQDKSLATSGGTRVTQSLSWAGAGCKIVVGDGGEVAHRTYPMELDGGVGAGGFEFIRALDLAGNAPRLADEACALLTAPPCPAGTTTLILDTPQLALQIHESCGHPTESDRAFGDEVSLAGKSFLVPSTLGRKMYGSAHVNLTADALSPGGLGTFGWDDEGVPARKTPLVARGLHVGYLTSRETAARLDLPRSGGCLRAESWNRFPIVRMINVSLEPDPRGPTLDELIADTSDGILLGNNRSWSIDDLRLNFQFGCEIAWEIKNGKRGRILKNPIYGGTTPRFWSGCDAVCGPGDWKLWGLVSCGKGDPMQLMAVAHGCSPARFRDVTVGSGA